MFCASLYEDCIIRGDGYCELLSLLFQTAIYHATRGHRVTFICDSQAMNNGLPLLNRHFNISDNKQILKSINIKYCNNLLDLTQFFTHIHLFNSNNSDNIPHVVIVHDIITLLEVSLFVNDDDDNDNGVEVDYFVPPDSTDEEEDDDDNDGNNDNENNYDYDSDSNNDDFLDENGNLDYGIKLANFLPILHETQKCVKNMLQTTNTNNKKNTNNNNNNEPFLKEMICIFGMECLENEFEELYPFWRNWKFKRFLRCNFDKTTNIISIKYDTDKDTENKQENNGNNFDDNDVEMEMTENKRKKPKKNRKEPPTVYCYVAPRNIDMIAMSKGIKKIQT